jgi:hypothetical protein
MPMTSNETPEAVESTGRLELVEGVKVLERRQERNPYGVQCPGVAGKIAKGGKDGCCMRTTDGNTDGHGIDHLFRYSGFVGDGLHGLVVQVVQLADLTEAGF